MDTIELLALIFAILLALTTIPNIVIDINYIGWAIYLSWVATIENLVASIFIMIGACKPLSYTNYNTCKYLLIFGDVIAFFVMIIFIAVLNALHWAKILNMVIITPLIVFVNIIQKKIAQNQPMLNPMVVQPGYAQPAAAPLVGQNAPYPNTYQAQSPSPYPS